MIKAIMTSNLEKGIEGYTAIPIIQGTYRLAELPNNSCSHLVCDHAIESCNPDVDVVEDVSNLIRKGGQINLIGVDLDALCQHYLSKQVNDEEFSDFVTKFKNTRSLSSVRKKLSNKGMIITSVQVKGIQYEISAVRQ
tara:strand:+ start:5887 stop:6300 length:414 start_codon:yes stop_codon:yes gene_type:complete